MRIDGRGVSAWGSIVKTPMLFLYTILVTGCGGSALCPAGTPDFGVQVEFFNASTAERLTGVTRGAIHEGGYLDSLVALSVDEHGAVVLLGAGQGRTGTFELTAERAGYEAYSRTGIRVGSGNCGVIPEYVDAMLQPAQGGP